MRHLVLLSVLTLACGEARFTNLPAAKDRLDTPTAGAPDGDSAGETGSPPQVSNGGEGGEAPTVVHHPHGSSGTGGSPTVVNRETAGEAGMVDDAPETGAAGHIEAAGTGGAAAGAGAVAGSGGSGGVAGSGGQSTSVGGAGAGGVAGSPAGGSGGSVPTFCPTIPAAWDGCNEPAAPGVYSLTVPSDVYLWRVQGTTAQRYWAGTNAYYATVTEQNPCTDKPMFTEQCATLKGPGTTRPGPNQSYILTIYVEVLEGQTIPCVTTTTNLNESLSCHP